jgi:hypothetical protein
LAVLPGWPRSGNEELGLVTRHRRTAPWTVLDVRALRSAIVLRMKPIGYFIP